MKGVNFMKIQMLVFALLIVVAACGKNYDAIPGPMGPTGANGAAGPAGDTGGVGPQGAPGQSGTDAESVTVVQLCSGAPTYGSVYPEVAFCIQGRLYATYSANGGFSTYLSPGSYNSNAVGSSCSFAVLEGCEIQ